jgi:hypothetical protein
MRSSAAGELVKFPYSRSSRQRNCGQRKEKGRLNRTNRQATSSSTTKGTEVWLIQKQQENTEQELG